MPEAVLWAIVAKMLRQMRATHLLALLAAIMLVIGGVPARASATPCDPCPPDCPMMQQMAKAADHQAPTPDKGGKPDSPCKSGVLCQALGNAAPASLHVTTVQFIASAAETLTPALQLLPPSRPPDPGLRPPIQL